MYKKFSTALLCVFLSFLSFAQNNEINVINRSQVSAEPQNKKILLEEFTGIHCGNCPDGHAMAKKLHTAKPEDVFIIAVHAGYYAEPGADQADLRTDDGIELHDFFGADG